MVVVFTLSALVWSPVFAVLNYFVLDQPILGHIALAALVFGGVILVFQRVTGAILLAGHMLAAFYLLELLLVWAWTGGIRSPTVAWCAGIPMVVTLIVGRTPGLVWTLLASATTVALLLAELNGRPMPTVLDDRGHVVTLAVSLVGIQVLTFTICLWFDAINRRAVHEIHAEQSILKRLLHRQEVELQLLGYDLHDGLTQMLAGAAMHLDIGRDAIPTGSQDRAELDRASTLLRESLTEARRLIAGLRPAVLEEHGLVAAIEELIRQSRLTVQFQHQLQPGRLNRLLEASLFRICQESLANAEKHGASALVEVELMQPDDLVCLSIRDQGAGFDVERQPAGFGLEGIRQRARILGGRSEIKSHPGQGTSIRVELPLSLAEE
jgi:signal transduction histidine kinase